MITFNKFFDLANKNGITALEIYYEKSYSLSFSLFHSELETYTLADKAVLSVRGIYNNKFGYAFCEKIDNSAPDFIIQQIIDNASNIDKDDVPIIFEGSKKYKKYNPFNADLSSMPIDEKIKMLHEIEDKLKKCDPRIVEISGCAYEESAGEIVIVNSHGLKLKQKHNHFYVYANAVAKKDEDTKTGHKIHISNDIKSFNIDRFVEDVRIEAVSKLGGAPCASKKYKAILSPDVVGGLLNAFLQSAVAEEVQKHSSLFEGKLNTLVASKKLTITEMPLTKNVFYRGFDDEGVATFNKHIIEKGILKTFLYNLETAKIDNAISTGNGYRPRPTSAVNTSTINVTIKPGKDSEEELIQKTGEGIYISDIQGLHSGLNTTSGDFSLQASGFLIKNGKLSDPVNLITIAGNLVSVFKDVTRVGKNVTLLTSSMNVPSLVIKKIAVSGK